MDHPDMEPPGDPRLSEIFSRINLSDFPAMTGPVGELKGLAEDPRSTLTDLVNVILLDHGMTIKVLREANSAFYAHSQPVTSVTVAAGRIGFDAIKERVIDLPLLEECLKMIGEPEALSLLTRSFVNAALTRTICTEKRIGIAPEDAFVCGLLHQLGKTVAILYLPDRYRKVNQLKQDGTPENEAARTVFYGLDYSGLAVEVAKFWNLSDLVVSTMPADPPPPQGPNDPAGFLHNAVCFSHLLTNGVCEEGQTNILFDRYGEILSLHKEEALEFLKKSAAMVKAMTPAYRQCLLKLKIGSKIRRMQSLIPGSIRPKRAERKAAPGEDDQARQDTISTFFHEVNKALEDPFDFHDFTAILLTALQKGIGFDRVVLTSLSIKPNRMALVGRFGAGDITPEEVNAFRHPLSDQGQVITRCMTLRQDMALVVDKQTAMPPLLRKRALGRFLYLLPICLDTSPYGLLYLDRRAGRLPLTDPQFKAAGAFRDLMTMGIRRDLAAFTGE